METVETYTSFNRIRTSLHGYQDCLVSNVIMKAYFVFSIVYIQFDDICFI